MASLIVFVFVFARVLVSLGPGVCWSNGRKETWVAGVIKTGYWRGAKRARMGYNIQSVVLVVLS